MKNVFKRVRSSILACFILISVNLACACNGWNDLIITDNFIAYDGFSVNFLDVGEGDAIFIRFNDGKTMLIDCGEKNDKYLRLIERYLDEYAKNGLDYFVLTHTDSDHVGNAENILENYLVRTAYVPYLIHPEQFGAYYKAYRIVEANGIAKTSVAGIVITGVDYYAVFLSPNAIGTTDGAYKVVNSADIPSAGAINDLSPIIYLEYKGVKFLFTGDAGIKQEKTALNNINTGIIDQELYYVGKSAIDISDIDFLKVSHHGANDASGEEFLSKTTPQNAVVSVGGNNYGHPSKETISRLLAANENCNIYLTSEYGTVSVFVDDDGKVTVKTAA